MEKYRIMTVLPQNIKKAIALTAVRLLSAHCCVKQPHYTRPYRNSAWILMIFRLCWFSEHWHFDFWFVLSLFIFLHVCNYKYVKNRCVDQLVKCQMIWPTFVEHPIIILRLLWLSVWLKTAGYHKHKSVTDLFFLRLWIFSVVVMAAVRTVTILWAKRQWQWMVI